MPDLSGRLFDFAMVLTRISAFLLVLPVFGSNGIPARIKVSLVMLLSVFFLWVAPQPSTTGTVPLVQAVLMLSSEAIYGLALGLIVAIVFLAVRLGAEIVEQQMGFAVAEILDPLTGDTTQPLGSLFETLFILIFLAANGHHLFLTIIWRSYTAFPAGHIPTAASLVGGIIQAGTAMMTVGLKLAAPMLAAFLVLMVVLAVFARVIPEMDILFNSMPLCAGLGLLLMAIFVQYLSPFVAEFSQLMNKLLPL
jgi:flagellar biosynthesis protein FliR